MSNQVAYAYFTTTVERPMGFYMPVGYREFNVDTDERVIFVCLTHNPGPAYVLRGILRRPDSTPHTDFRREVPARHPGTRSQYPTTEEFAMKDLKAFPGDWTLDLAIDDEKAGAFAFFVGDARAISQARKRRAE